MNVLEKILEEIEEENKTADAAKFYCEELWDAGDWYESGYIDGQLSAHRKCMDIICSHMPKKEKVSSAEIISRNIDGKPYYGIKYKKVGEHHYTVG